MNRYHRQTLLPQIGPQGQERLARARVLLVGCGALGSVIADQLVRAGVGWLRLVDRDIVELTNLQRQVLFDESDAAQALPKAVAAARRLSQVNSSVKIDPQVLDVNSGNAERLAGADGHGSRVDLILDGTDNVETRYLVNDVAVKHGIPWIYGACVGTEGRMMAVRPGVTPCLRCLFPEPPGAGELPTCDTAGVLGAAAAVVASLQSAAAIQLLTGWDESSSALVGSMIRFDIWRGRFHGTTLADACRDDCATCAARQFTFLDHLSSGTTTLCGRNAVQIRPREQGAIMENADVLKRLERVATIQRSPFFIRVSLDEESVELTVFNDGRVIVHGTGDEARARSIYAKYIGA